MFEDRLSLDRENVALHCDTHGEYEGFRTTFLGRTTNSICPRCQAEKEQQEQAKRQQERAEQEQEEINRCIANIGLPFRFKGASFDNYYSPTDEHKNAVHGCTEFAVKIEGREYANLILMGRVGTGKTHLAAALCKRFAGQLISAKYTSVREIVQSVRETWGGRSTESESDVLLRYTNPDVLVIDEVGVQNGSANEQTILFDVINERYASMSPVILVSNLDASGIKQAIGDRSFDRIRDSGSYIPFTWGSYRGQAKTRSA